MPDVPRGDQSRPDPIPPPLELPGEPTHDARNVARRPSSRQRLPGNRVVRKRMDATQVIAIPEDPEHRAAPTIQSHAKVFVGGFLLVVAIGALLLMLPLAAERGQTTRPIDALFTAMSASAVTGLTVVDTQDHWSLFGEAVILVLMQLGGLGFMVGASIVLVSLGRGSSLRDAIMLQDGSPAMSLSEAVSLSKRILRFIFVTEAIGAVLLTIRFLRDESPLVAIWYGVFHAVSAFCNAGFDLQGNFQSLGRYETSPWINGTIVALIQAGALSYMVLDDAWKTRRWSRFQLDTKLVLLTNAILVATGAILFILTEWNAALANTPDWARPMVAVFQSASVRTAGFTTVNFGDVHSPTVFLWIGMMMIGGASGSTAGGIKLATAAVVFVAVVNTLRGETQTQIFKRRIPTYLVFRAMAIIAVYVLAHFVFSLLLGFTEDVLQPNDLTFLDLMLETMSAAATAGLTTGITPDLSTAGKLIVCGAMFFGRFGPITLVYALTRRQRLTRYKYPEAPIRMG
ncbi:MAG: TrkH family potassium uptake protein [Thermomicrobiales bacterium]